MSKDHTTSSLSARRARPSARSTARCRASRLTSSAKSPSRPRWSARKRRAGRGVSEVILGQILTAGHGQNPARQASIAAGIPVDAPAWGMNQLCGSGLRAVALGFQQIQTGDRRAIVVAGGQESMSQSPHAAHLRDGTKMGDVEFIDTMIKDGLWDAFNGYHMGTTAENVAEQWQITREEQDEFAVASQNKAEAAQKAGKFKDEIVAGHDQDQQGRHDRRAGRIHQATARRSKRSAKLGARLQRRTAPSPPPTPSGINDGAAAPSC